MNRKSHSLSAAQKYPEKFSLLECPICHARHLMDRHRGKKLRSFELTDETADEADLVIKCYTCHNQIGVTIDK